MLGQAARESRLVGMQVGESFPKLGMKAVGVDDIARSKEQD